MEDLISRQDAIDAIKEFKHGAAEWRDEQEERSDIWHRADSAIASAIEIGLRVKKLPSAQQWIPCSERLPEVKGDYLVTYHPCYWDNVESEIKVGIDSFRGKTAWAKRKYQMVIAWMPLPEPYKMDGEEQDNE